MYGGIQYSENDRVFILFFRINTFSGFHDFFSKKFRRLNGILVDLYIIAIYHCWSLFAASLTQAAFDSDLIFIVFIEFYICLKSFFDVFAMTFATCATTTDFYLYGLHGYEYREKYRFSKKNAPKIIKHLPFKFIISDIENLFRKALVDFFIFFIWFLILYLYNPATCPKIGRHAPIAQLEE